MLYICPCNKVTMAIYNNISGFNLIVKSYLYARIGIVCHNFITPYSGFLLPENEHPFYTSFSGAKLKNEISTPNHHASRGRQFIALRGSNVKNHNYRLQELYYCRVKTNRLCLSVIRRSVQDTNALLMRPFI